MIKRKTDRGNNRLIEIEEGEQIDREFKRERDRKRDRARERKRERGGGGVK